MKKYSLGALVAAGLLVGGLSAGSASAADLGGNCCADLEERIAELEATTARKGNRKVSLTISGWVGEQVMYWDDGVEQNAYVTGLGSTLASHFKFSGQAIITPGFSAGYVIHVEANDSDSLTIDQFSQHNFSALSPANPGSGAFYVQLLQSFWFLKSDHLGKVSVGLQSSASDNAAILVDGSGSLVPANWVMFDYNNFKVRSSGPIQNLFAFGTVGGANAFGIQNFGGFCRGGGGAGGDCFGAPRDSIRYDSPTFGGFSVSASWGEDDFWDVAARYAGEWNGIKLAVTGAYTEWTCDFGGSKAPFNGGAGPSGLVQVGANSAFSDFGCGQGATLGINNVANVPGIIPAAALNGVAAIQGDKDTNYFQLGAYVEHVPTGLWAYGAYGRTQTDAAVFDLIASLTANQVRYTEIPDGDTWYGKVGLRERWTPLGHTVLYGEYAEYKDSVPDGFTFFGVSADTTMYGIGVVQEIDAAAMSLWLSYRHVSMDIDATTVGAGAFTGQSSCTILAGANCALEDFQYIKGGALINF